MNLFLMLHALGLGHELHGEHLLPVGTVYDPFICRGLDALIYGLYNGARFVVAGTPAGVTLAPEGGAHQSTITPSIGMELPGITLVEPAYAQALDWLLCDGLRNLVGRRERACTSGCRLARSTSGRLRTALERLGLEQLRPQVISGGYRLVEPTRPAEIVIAASGAVVPEACAAARTTRREGIAAVVLDLTSPDRLYRAWRHELRDAARAARHAPGAHPLAALLAPGRATRPDPHRARRRKPHACVARIRVRRSGGPGRRRRLRSIRVDRRAVPPLRPAPRTARQCRARRGAWWTGGHARGPVP